MTVAVIDIGTNTVLLLVAEISSGHIIRVLADEQRLPRLGKDVDASRTLRDDSIGRVLAVLSEYRGIISTFNPDAVVPVATSAVRDAHNQSLFLDAVQTATHLQVRVLTGDDEALFTYRGALSGLSHLARATVIDIGGGSTEITTGTRDAIESHASIDVGAVRLTERFFRHDPPTADEIEQAAMALRNDFSNAGIRPAKDSTLVGVAGTAISLAMLTAGKNTADRSLLAGTRVSLPEVSAQLARMMQASSAEILTWSDFLVGRADIITAGTLILQEFCLQEGFTGFIASDRGLRYGVALHEADLRSRK